jgi:hypothetical protein
MPIRSRLLTVAIFCSIADLAVAQQARVQPNTGIVPWSVLNGRPSFAGALRDAAIRYPEVMRSSNVEGLVRLRVIVGADGVPEPTFHSMFAPVEPRRGPVDAELARTQVAKRANQETGPREQHERQRDLCNDDAATETPSRRSADRGTLAEERVRR